MRTTVRWLLTAAGALGAILAGSSPAWAADTATARSTTPAGATTVSTLAGKYALVVTTPAPGSATSTSVDVVPVEPPLTRPTVPSTNRAPGWSISSVDPAGFPLLLLVLVALFLMVQSWVDRRDPKLALASVAADADLQFGPPPSRGDA